MVAAGLLEQVGGHQRARKLVEYLLPVSLLESHFVILSRFVDAPTIPSSSTTLQHSPSASPTQRHLYELEQFPGVNTPRSTSQAPELNSEYTVLMSQGNLVFVVVEALVASRTMRPVTNSGCRAVRQRRKTVLQLCHRFSCWKGIEGWEACPASKAARETAAIDQGVHRVRVIVEACGKSLTGETVAVGVDQSPELACQGLSTVALMIVGLLRKIGGNLRCLVGGETVLVTDVDSTTLGESNDSD
nr:hypothetical protein CFP56_74660 [Quercus suber]